MTTVLELLESHHVNEKEMETFMKDLERKRGKDMPAREHDGIYFKSDGREAWRVGRSYAKPRPNGSDPAGCRLTSRELIVIIKEYIDLKGKFTELDLPLVKPPKRIIVKPPERPVFIDDDKGRITITPDPDDDFGIGM